ncbi:hypothetical protein GPECTOR_219g464 [Gonium pectorale]|uniref:Uncharacterized protein n=1 Tax=Gonium pectorale TaxID=33097 RepID=A0A150FWS8_GONPE|nr:hypothetical protein GPECTOR_219g464 [Gonium pectorale]|eukprot:KXZ42028.1 hypothetical protein GPECTOR_219g464 [Gonium pectorale]
MHAAAAATAAASGGRRAAAAVPYVLSAVVVVQLPGDRQLEAARFVAAPLEALGAPFRNEPNDDKQGSPDSPPPSLPTPPAQPPPDGSLEGSAVQPSTPPGGASAVTPGAGSPPSSSVGEDPADRPDLSAATQSGSGGGGRDVGPIVAAVVVPVVCIAAIAVALYIYQRRRYMEQAFNSIMTPLEIDDRAEVAGLSASSPPPPEMADPTMTVAFGGGSRSPLAHSPVGIPGGGSFGGGGSPRANRSGGGGPSPHSSYSRAANGGGIGSGLTPSPSRVVVVNSDLPVNYTIRFSAAYYSSLHTRLADPEPPSPVSPTAGGPRSPPPASGRWP